MLLTQLPEPHSFAVLQVVPLISLGMQVPLRQKLPGAQSVSMPQAVRQPVASVAQA
jgi:hypothetical protein